MAAKKMFPPQDFGNRLSKEYDEVKLGISFRIVDSQIVMQFSDHVDMGPNEQRRRSKAGGDAFREGQRTGPFG